MADSRPSHDTPPGRTVALGALPMTDLELRPTAPFDSAEPLDLTAALDEALPTKRYELGPEIARGGMGAVHRCFDRQLGRELAVKVLLPELVKRPDVLRRFVEEAQVGGQLQHPGVVPVHELGRLEDGRPFFAMKLVKGRTLAELLKERAGPGDNLPRLLKVFEQVCQTLAYAHARRVIHRDLKPANVMVGAFGEVQVMDWGLAKVLGASAADDTTDPGGETASIVNTGRSGDPSDHTVAGSVMGTYAYMAPEQARGELELVDERSDVFGLGGILCETLTGRPPYVGRTLEEVRSLALRGDLAPTLERLNRSGAEPALVALARKCLAPEPGDRPRDAGAVAAEVSSYLAGVAERLKAAEIERAAAQARARAERGRRRATVALAGAVVVALALAGGGWAWLDRQHSARIEETLRQARPALDNAARLRKQAAAVLLTDLDQWRKKEDLCKEAVAAAEQAEKAVAAGEPDAATRQALDELLQPLRDEARAATNDRKMLERLHAISFVANDAVTDDDFDHYLATHGNEDRFIYSPAAGASEYGKAFREYGVNVETLPVEQAAAAIGERQIKADLIAALDDWLRLTETGPRRDNLLRIARASDPEPTRDRLRRALAAGDLKELKDLAQLPSAARMPVSAVLLLADGLFQKNEVTPAVALLRQAQRLHADDFWLNDKLGEYLMYTGAGTPPQMEEAMRFFTAALVVRPQSQTARVNLADALAYTAAYEEAEAAYRQALEDRPTLAYVRNKLAALLAADGRYDKALEESARAVEQRPQSAYVHEGRAGVCFMAGRYEEAVAAYRKAIGLHPDIGSYYSGLGQALAELGHTAEAIEAHGEAVRLKPSAQTYAKLADTLVKCGRIQDAVEAARTALRLQPGSPPGRSSLANALAATGRHAEAVELYREAVALTPRDAGLWWRLGHVLRSQGKNEEAAASVREAIRRGPRQGPRLAAMYNELGLICSDLGQKERAAAALRQAAEVNPYDAVIRENLGDALRDQGALPEAADAYREAMRLKPDWSEPRARLVEALEGLDRVDEAAAVLEQAGLGNAEAFYRLVRLFQDHGRHREALEQLEPWLRVRPDDGVALHRLAVSLEKTGRLEEALAAYEKALTGTASLRLDRAGAAFDFGGALLERSRRLGERGEADEGRLAAARGHAYLAWGWSKLGKKAAAADEAAEAVKHKPTEPKYYRLLVAALKETRPEAALLACCSALALDPAAAEDYLTVAELLRELERPAEAIAACELSLQRWPDDERARRTLGRLLMEAGRLQEAAVQLERGRDQDALKRCRRLQELEPRLSAYRAGAAKAADEDLLELASLCLLRRLPATASRLYAAAAAANLLPPGSEEGHRAAEAAALAGCGRGGDAGEVGEAERRRLRGRALEWLRAEWAAAMQSLTASGGEGRVQATLARWQRESALAGVRDAAALDELPEAERQSWRAFWAQVDSLRQLASARDR